MNSAGTRRPGTVPGRAGQITCPTLITEGEGDFASQSGILFDALACEKQYHGFTAAEGGGGHCEEMGQRLWQQVAFSWLSAIVARGQPDQAGPA